MFLIEVYSILSLQGKYCFFPGWHGLGIIMCPLIFKFSFVLWDAKYFLLFLYFSVYSFQRSCLLSPTWKLAEIALSSPMYLFQSLLYVSAHIELLTSHNFYISDWLFRSGCKSHSDLPLVPSSFSINSLELLLVSVKASGKSSSESMI